MPKGKPHRLWPRYPGHLLFALTGAKLAEFTKWDEEFGAVLRIKLGPEHFYLVNDPESIKQILTVRGQDFGRARGLDRTKLLLGNGILTSDGTFHRSQRRVLKPAFDKSRIFQSAQTMCEASVTRSNDWHHGETRDMHREMSRLALDIAGKVLFSSSTKEFASAVEESLAVSLESFKFAIFPFTEYLQNLPIPRVLRFKRAKQTLDNIIYQMIEEHRKNPPPQPDVISLLLNAQKEGQAISDEQIRDEAVTLLLAGHETTANALTWTWYLLSQYPDIESKFHQELKSVLNGRLPTAEDMGKLDFTRRVFTESMRLFPPAYMVGRRALVDVPMGEYTIPKDATILMSQYVVHRSKRYYEDPLIFNPDRWLPEHAEKRHRYAYFPFGAGGRQCVGEQMAWLEGILVLATIGQRWRMRLHPSTQVALDPAVTLRPKHGMGMILESANPLKRASEDQNFEPRSLRF